MRKIVKEFTAPLDEEKVTLEATEVGSAFVYLQSPGELTQCVIGICGHQIVVYRDRLASRGKGVVIVPPEPEPPPAARPAISARLREAVEHARRRLRAHAEWGAMDMLDHALSEHDTTDAQKRLEKLIDGVRRIPTVNCHHTVKSCLEALANEAEGTP